MKINLTPRATRLNQRDKDALAGATWRALQRAKQHSWKPTLGPWGHYFVPSAHEPGITRTVKVEVGPEGILWFDCSCPSGFFRDTEPLSCWHSAAVGHLMVNTGYAWYTQEGIFRRRKPNDELRDSTGRLMKIPAFKPSMPGNLP